MPGPIQSVERAAAVLNLLGAGPSGLAELAAALDLPKPTVHGIVRTLCHVGFVEQDPDDGRYRIGDGLAELGRGGVDKHELRSQAMNWTDRLAARTQLEVHVGVPCGPSIELVHHVFRPDDSPQHLVTGELRPLHATALGKVVLAHVPGAGPVRSMPLPAFTTRTRTDRAALVAELDGVRRRGYAVEAGEHQPGRAAVAAPIRGRGGVAVAALAVVGPQERLLDASGTPFPALVDQTVRAGRAVSEQIAARW